MRASRSLSFHDQIRFIRIIFFLLLGGQGLYFLISWIFKSNTAGNPELNRIFDYLVPVMLFISIFGARFLYRNMLNKAKTLEFRKKLDNYRSAVIVSLAILEGANIISITAFMLTGDYLYVAASVIMFLLFILNSPSEEKFRVDLELTPEELSHTE